MMNLRSADVVTRTFARRVNTLALEAESVNIERSWSRDIGERMPIKNYDPRKSPVLLGAGEWRHGATQRGGEEKEATPRRAAALSGVLFAAE